MRDGNAQRDGHDDHPFGPAAAGANRFLWLCVLLRAFEDACGNVGHVGYGDSRAAIVAEARAWFREGGPDLEAVCGLADLDSDVVLAQVLPQIADEAPLRAGPRDSVFRRVNALRVSLR